MRSLYIEKNRLCNDPFILDSCYTCLERAHHMSETVLNARWWVVAGEKVAKANKTVLACTGETDQ